MAKKPTTRKAAKKPANPVGRPPAGDRQAIAFRCPNAVLKGIDARAAREGLSRNDALIAAGAAWGDFAEGQRPALSRTKLSAGERVKTSEPEPVKPGSRLDKSTIGKRTGPPINKKAVPAPAAHEEEGV